MSSIVKTTEGKIVLYSIGDSNVYVDVIFNERQFFTIKAFSIVENSA